MLPPIFLEKEYPNDSSVHPASANCNRKASESPMPLLLFLHLKASISAYQLPPRQTGRKPTHPVFYRCFAPVYSYIPLPGSSYPKAVSPALVHNNQFQLWLQPWFALPPTEVPLKSTGITSFYQSRFFPTEKPVLLFLIKKKHQKIVVTHQKFFRPALPLKHHYRNVVLPSKKDAYSWEYLPDV